MVKWSADCFGVTVVTVSEWKLVTDAVSDGIRQIYGSNNELRQNSSTQKSSYDDQDVLACHLPKVVFNVETDVDQKSEPVDALDSIWLTREDLITSETRPNRRRSRCRRNFIRSVPDPQMESSTSDARKESQRRCSRCGTCLKSFLTFLFSTVGLTFLLTVYSILGGLMFMRLEADRENRTADEMEKQPRDETERLGRKNRTADEMEKLRSEYLSQLWQMTIRLNVLHPDVWMSEADSILKNYTVVVYTYTKMKGWDAGGQDEENQWSFAGSLLYSITVITTIGMHQSCNRHTRNLKNMGSQYPRFWNGITGHC